MSQKTIQISSGPSREELFDGLRLFTEKRKVSFIIEDNGRNVTLPVTMRSIQAEDGSGQKWNIEFNVPIKTLTLLSLIKEPGKAISPYAIAFKGYYSTQTRKGRMTAQ